MLILGFMKQLPNLLKQESSAASTYISILLRMYNDPREERVENKHVVEQALIP
jgi:brefeldin A-inhibited guanine nucleotide-exchange protein